MGEFFGLAFFGCLFGAHAVYFRRNTAFQSWPKATTRVQTNEDANPEFENQRSDASWVWTKAQQTDLHVFCVKPLKTLGPGRGMGGGGSEGGAGGSGVLIAVFILVLLLLAVGVGVYLYKKKKRDELNSQRIKRHNTIVQEQDRRQLELEMKMEDGY